MSYCFGWKNTTTVFLISDTASSNPEELDDSISSFGERMIKVNRKCLAEDLFKIQVIDKFSAIAFAGNVLFALTFIEKLKKDVKVGKKVRESFYNLVQHTLFKKDVAFILAYFDNGPNLLRFDSREHEIQDVVIAQIGSLGENYPKLTNSMVQNFIGATGTRPYECLTSLISWAQDYGIHDSLNRMLVGGIFFGLYIDTGGQSWPDPTTFLVYNHNMDTLHFEIVNVRAYGNYIEIESSFNGLIKCIPLNSNEMNSEALIKKADHIEIRPNSDFFVFFSDSHRIIAVISVFGNLTNEYFRLNNNNLQLSKEFYEELFGYLQTANGYEPFRIYWKCATQVFDRNIEYIE